MFHVGEHTVTQCLLFWWSEEIILDRDEPKFPSVQPRTETAETASR